MPGYWLDYPGTYYSGVLFPSLLGGLGMQVWNMSDLLMMVWCHCMVDLGISRQSGIDWLLFYLQKMSSCLMCS